MMGTLLGAGCTKQAALKCDKDSPCQEKGYWCDLSPPYPDEPGVCRPFLDGSVVDPDAELADAGPDGEVLTPAMLAMTPTTQEFGSVFMGAQSAEVRFDVSNGGGMAAGALTVALAGADAAHFTISSDTCVGIPLGGAATCAVTLRFIPSSVGAKTAMLTVGGAPGGSVSATLTGTGLMPGALQIAPASHDFGNIVSGGQSTEQTFTVTNTGSGATGVPSAALSDSSNFSITMNNCSAALAASATCTIKARFNPGSTGSKLSSLTVMATPGGAAPASLSGTGISQAALTITPATQDLGSLVIGTMSAPFAFTVRNTGASPSGMITPTLASTDFTIASNGCTGTLAAGATCSISVQFTAATPAGAKTAMLSVAASPGGTAMSTVTGTAISMSLLTITPATHPFGNVLTGAMSAEQTFTVTNTGGAATSVPTTTLSDTTNFTVTMNGCTAVLNGGASCTVKARFTPTTVASHNATLQVAAATGGTAVSQLSGTGQAPATLSITPATRDFGPVTIGQSAGPLTFTISNVGNSTTGTITAVVGDTTHYMVSSNCTTLAPGANCTASVTYTASGTAGAQNSTIMVSSTPGGTVQSSLTAQAITVSQLAISPANPAAFASVVEGGTGATQMFTITNNGGSASGIPSVGFATATNDFTITNNQCLAALSPSGTCTVSVRFNPSVAGNLNANLRISASPGGIASAMVSGIGLRKAALSITPSTQDFGMVVTGMQSAFFTFTVSNTGEVTSSTVAVALATSPSDFAIDTGTNTCTTTLAAAGTCTVRVRMTAGTPGAKSNTLQATAGAGVSASSALTGTSLASGVLEITPTSGAFGSTLLNTTAATTQTFTVRNMGGSPTGQVSMSSSAEFPIMTDNCTTTLAAGAMCTVVVQFRPTVRGARMGSVTATASPGGAASADLSGTGQSPADLTIIGSASLNFGTVIVGQTATQSFTVRNTGDVSTGIPSKVFMPTTDYTIMTDNCTAALAPANQCTVTVRYTAGALGTSNATLDITASPGGTERITLTGEAVNQGTLSITPTTWPFGSLVIGDTGGTAKTFVVRNTGGVNTGAVSVTPVGDFVVNSTTCGPALAPNATCDIVARFQPTAAGARNGSVTASATPGGDAPASLSGTGLAPATIEVTPDPQDFGSAVNPATTTRTLTVRNTGGVATTALTRSVTGTGFAITTDGCAGTLGAGAMCSITVTFTAQTVLAPATSSSQGGTLTVSATTGGTDTATLTGTSLAPGALSITGNTSFPTTAVGAVSTARAYTVTNTGGVSIGPITMGLSGTNSADFTQVAGGTCAGATLNPGANCTVNVTMTPSAAGTRNATLTATSGATSAPANLSGSGSATLTTTLGGAGSGTLSFNPAGTPDCGANCRTITTSDTVVITATPSATSEVDSWTGNCTSTTATTCTVGLTVATRSVTANFKFRDVLTGSPSPLAFGDLAVDAYSDLRQITIQNPSSFTTGTLAVTLEGANASEFELINNNCNTALATNGSCTFSVFFKPGSAGGKSTSAKVVASPGGTLNIPVTGSALAYRPLVFYSASSPAINPPGSLEGGPHQFESFQQGTFVYYTNRTGGPGGWDIWASYSTNTSRPWSEPAPIGISGVNTAADEINPFMPNNLSFYFVRNSGGYSIQQAYWVDHPSPFPDGFECCIAGPSGASPSVTNDELVLYYIVPGSPPVLMRAQRATPLSGWGTPQAVPLPGGYAYSWARITGDERGLLLGNPYTAGAPQVAQLWRSSTAVTWSTLPMSAIKGIPALSAASNLDPGFGSDGILVSVGGDLAYSSIY